MILVLWRAVRSASSPSHLRFIRRPYTPTLSNNDTRMEDKNMDRDKDKTY